MSERFTNVMVRLDSFTTFPSFCAETLLSGLLVLAAAKGTRNQFLLISLDVDKMYLFLSRFSAQDKHSPTAPSYMQSANEGKAGAQWYQMAFPLLCRLCRGYTHIDLYIAFRAYRKRQLCWMQQILLACFVR